MKKRREKVTFSSKINGPLEEITIHGDCNDLLGNTIDNEGIMGELIDFLEKKKIKFHNHHGEVGEIMEYNIVFLRRDISIVRMWLLGKGLEHLEDVYVTKKYVTT